MVCLTCVDVTNSMLKPREASVFPDIKLQPAEEVKARLEAVFPLVPNDGVVQHGKVHICQAIGNQCAFLLSVGIDINISRSGEKNEN